MRMRSCMRIAAVAAGLAAGSAATSAPDGQELLYVSEGNRLRRLDIDTIDRPHLQEDILIERASLDPIDGRDVNGMLCLFPDASGRFVLGEDTDQPSPPPGWGVMAPDGSQIGKLTASYFTQQAEPFGCAFAADGTLFTTEVGTQGFGAANGQLILWFPPYDRFPGPPGAYPDTDAPSRNFCKIATDIGTAGGIVIDESGRVYVASSSGLSVQRFSPPFPTSPDAAGGCGATDALGSPLADSVNRETFIILGNGLVTYSGLALAPNGNLYAASVLTGRIGEFDLEGNFLRLVLDPPESGLPFSTGTPQGLAVDSKGTLYYADLDLVGTPPDDIGPGPNGKIWRIRFDEQGDPLPPEIVRQNLAFPDGLGIFPGDLEPSEWRTYAGSPRRLFFNPDESTITPANVGALAERWRFPTGAIITASPTLAAVDVPGEGRIQVTYFPSWDAKVYAVRLADGSELWHFETEEQPGASYPNAASVHVAEIDGRDQVLIGAGEIMYSLDAVTGHENWRFTAGTGCVDEQGNPPGLCAFDGERNQIESSAMVADGKVFFGMDVNDVPSGKGGFYAVDAQDGRLVWFFDLESGSTCRTLPGENVRGYDGYHSAAELGLPPGLSERPGCDFDRTPTGCGNVWSSPAIDFEREMLWFASSNCDTDEDPGSPLPPPPMPPYDEAVVALDFDGQPVWRWRPREVDTDDLAFGAVPNLFAISVDGQLRDAVGVGNKDGTYTVLDRDGVNIRNGVRWDDPDPSALPYWTTKVVPGGSLGGILATAAADEAARRIYFSTAPGFSPFDPQRPTMHALDMDTGAIVWDNGGTTDAILGDASFSPTSAIPGVAFTGAVVTPLLRAYETETGRLRLADFVAADAFGSAVASAPVVIDGTLLVGTGIGARSSDPESNSDVTSRIPSDLVALCVPGTPGCRPCDDPEDGDEDGVGDSCDNCIALANPDQRDSNGDGYGNFCDADLDNDGTVGFLDLGLLRSVFLSQDEDADLNGDGTVDRRDLDHMKSRFFRPPGPSAYAPTPAP